MSGPPSGEDRFRLRPAIAAAAAAPAAIAAAATAAAMVLDAPERLSTYGGDDFAAGALLLILVFWNAFVVAALHAVLLGYPLYRLLRSHEPVGWPLAALAGFMIGAVPIQLLALSMQERLVAALTFGLFGIAGALAFRRTLYRSP